MSHFFRFVCLALTIALLCGCHNFSESQPSTSDNSVSTGSSAQKEDTPLSESRDPASTFSESPTSAILYDSSQIPGKVNNLYFAHDNKILIYSDTLSLYDPSNGTVTAQYDVGSSSSLMCFTLNNGYAIITDEAFHSVEPSFQATSSEKFVCTFLSEQLEPISQIDISQYFGEGDVFLSSAVSSDGKTLALAGVQFLYIVQTENSTCTTIDLTTCSVEGIRPSGINGMHFGNSSNELLFTASTVDGPNVLGKITLDDQNVVTILPDQYSVGEEILSLGSEFAFVEDFMKASGNLLILDPTDMSTRIFPFSNAGEGADGVSISNGGKYIVTATLGSSSAKFRVYSAESESLIHEESITADPALFSRVPYYLVLEDSKTCFVLVRNGSDSQSFSFSF